MAFNPSEILIELSKSHFILDINASITNLIIGCLLFLGGYEMTDENKDFLVSYNDLSDNNKKAVRQLIDMKGFQSIDMIEIAYFLATELGDDKLDDKLKLILNLDVNINQTNNKEIAVGLVHEVRTLLNM